MTKDWPSYQANLIARAKSPHPRRVSAWRSDACAWTNSGNQLDPSRPTAAPSFVQRAKGTAGSHRGDESRKRVRALRDLRPSREERRACPRAAASHRPHLQPSSREAALCHRQHRIERRLLGPSDERKALGPVPIGSSALPAALSYSCLLESLRRRLSAPPSLCCGVSRRKVLLTQSCVAVLQPKLDEPTVALIL